MSGVFFFERSPNLEQNLLKNRHYDLNEDLPATEMLRGQMRTPKLICKLTAVLGFLILVVLSVALRQRHVATTTATAAAQTPVVKLTPLRECTNGVCYHYKNRDEEYAEYFIPSKIKVNEFKFDFILSPRKFCDSKTYLIILIPSEHTHVQERRAIRNTWGSISRGNQWPKRHVNLRIKLVFLFGKDREGKYDRIVENEKHLYGDVVQGNFLDTYQNLSNKVLLGLKWVSLFCSESQYVLKADEDTFVNIPKLLNVIKNVSHPSYRGVVLGNINDEAKVYRQGRWKVLEKNYPFPHFPTYASGNTYVISSNIAPSLFNMAEYMPYIPVEDAFITGVLAKVLDATHIGVPGFTFWMDKPPSACDFFLDKKISATKVNFRLMFYIWKKLNSIAFTCNKKS